jgi:flagellin
MLQRVRDLKVQLSNGTLDTNDKASVGAEVSQIASEVSSVLSGTQFNGKTVFNNSFTFQVGANDSETISVGAPTFSGDVSTGGLSNLTGLSGGAGSDVAASMANVTISQIDVMIENVSKQRGEYGAVQNRLEHRLNNLATYQENLTASESRIRDVDMAAEMTKFTKLNILQQAGTSMLAQANQAPQNVLSLLR